MLNLCVWSDLGAQNELGREESTDEAAEVEEYLSTSQQNSGLLVHSPADEAEGNETR